MKGKKEKKEFDQNIGLHEVFLESVPTALIITVIFVRAFAGKKILIIFVITVIHKKELLDFKLSTFYFSSRLNSFVTLWSLIGGK